MHPETAEELLDAIQHYEEWAGSEAAFAVAAKKARTDAAESPNAWPPVEHWKPPPLVRSRRIGNFPYRVIYYSRGDVVAVIAYAHEKRRPGYWGRRAERR
ncbi:type II toxin-antitoxin system RelE/ParE family toxin [Leucobacter chromiireducens]|uniref:type II toxin-antitoxin system RelE/ParE family toxin n=1 Tax=Leucobacter chromiireducens TaxID=283877 RepID=UPI000F63188E|nr:type II toxin-antitoxin system RelE/ParE family toxin [Leucobacter chromiireducens]